MIKGVGVDIVENSRFSSFPKGALEKIFTPFELEEMESRVEKTEYLASRFAVKEAVVKAYGTGFGAVGARDIETRKDEKGKPFVLVKGKKEESLHISLSHEKGYSIAFVVLEEL
ncbi:MAG: holo-ACP synthase [Candidatus Ornithospirochaeta sp.]